MKIILLGYMACGKSTIGKLLASEKKISFIDLDAYIEEKEGKTISEIFKKEGEIYFRLQEHKYLKELLNSEDDFVLSLGGGTPCYSGNMDIIASFKSNVTVYLRANVKTLVDRLKNEKTQRPLVATLSDDDKLAEFIAKHLFERSYFYEQAMHKITIDQKDTATINKEIVIALG